MTRAAGLWKLPACAGHKRSRSIPCSTDTNWFSPNCQGRMSDQLPQPSSMIFPVALQPAVQEDVEATAVAESARWGWLELFLLSQVLWGVLLFIPGSQSLRL